MLGARATGAIDRDLEAAISADAVQLAGRARADHVLLQARVGPRTLKVAHAAGGADEIGDRAAAVRTADHLAAHRGARGTAAQPRRDRADVGIARAAGCRAGGDVCRSTGARRIHRHEARIVSGGDWTVVGGRSHGVEAESTADAGDQADGHDPMASHGSNCTRLRTILRAACRTSIVSSSSSPSAFRSGCRVSLAPSSTSCRAIVARVTMMLPPVKTARAAARASCAGHGPCVRPRRSGCPGSRRRPGSAKFRPISRA